MSSKQLQDYEAIEMKERDNETAIQLGNINMSDEKNKGDNDVRDTDDRLDKRPDETCLDFGEKDVPDSFERSKLYVTNHRFWFPFFCSIFLIFGKNRNDYFGVKETRGWYWFCLVCGIVTLLYCLCAIGYATALYYKQYKKYTIDKKKSFIESINNILVREGGYYGTNSSFLKLFIFSTEKSVVAWMVFFLLFGSIHLCMISWALYDYNFGVECGDLINEHKFESPFGENKTKFHRSACALTVTSYSTTYALVACVAALAFMQKQSDVFQDGMIKKLSALLCDNYKKIIKENTNTIESNMHIEGSCKYHICCQLCHKTRKHLEYWRNETFHWKNNKCSTVIIVIISLFCHVILGLWRLNLFDKNGFERYHFWYLVLSFILMFFDSILVTAIVLFTIRLCSHFAFPGLIMNAINLDYEDIQRYIKTGNNLIDWWYLRRYFIRVIVHHYGQCEFQNVISFAIIGSVIMGFYVVFQIDNMFSKDAARGTGAIFLFWSLYLISSTFMFSMNGLKYVRSQRRHSQMIKKLKMSLAERSLNSENEILTDSERDSTNTIIDMIESDIETNVHVLKVFTINVDENFIIALNATIAGFIVSLGVELLSSL